MNVGFSLDRIREAVDGAASQMTRDDQIVRIAIDALMALLAGESVGFDGKTYRLSPACPRCDVPQKVKPPTYSAEWPAWFIDSAFETEDGVIVADGHIRDRMTIVDRLRAAEWPDAALALEGEAEPVLREAWGRWFPDREGIWWGDGEREYTRDDESVRPITIVIRP